MRESLVLKMSDGCCSRFRHSLMTWGEKFSGAEIDDAFGEFKIDGGMIDGAHLKSIMVAKKDDA